MILNVAWWHIYASPRVIGWDLPHVYMCQWTGWTNNDVLPIWSLGPNIRKIKKGQKLSVKNILEMSSVKCRPFCSSLNVLRTVYRDGCYVRQYGWKLPVTITVISTILHWLMWAMGSTSDLTQHVLKVPYNIHLIAKLLLLMSNWVNKWLRWT